VLPGFRVFTTQFYWTCFSTAQELLQALALGLGVKKRHQQQQQQHSPGGNDDADDDDDDDENDEDYFLGFHSGHANQLRLLHYPPVATARLAGASADLARMPAHSDWGSITLLFQDACGGLQVEAPGEEAAGRFVDAVPVEGALIVNVGDLLMRWSNGMYGGARARVCVYAPLVFCDFFPSPSPPNLPSF
jgi:isopenicillin N synthase-like dioxygenase